uniref:alkaline phosphatase n=1 Tax=Anopheles stephensi TaxID=30069 RepID=A0A182YLW7_ANOST
MSLVVLILATGSVWVQVQGHEEHDAHHWKHMAHELLFEKKDYTMQKINIAKNIMVFVGAGMSQATVTAARYYNGGDNETFAFERLKWSGNARVSAWPCRDTSRGTGPFCSFGSKTKPCPTWDEMVASVLESFDGKPILSIWFVSEPCTIRGFATTSRVTSGSTAALYANSPDSEWENDAAVNAGGCNTATVPDIAHQLIHSDIGKQFKGELASLDTTKIDYLLGLFDYDHLPFSADIGNGSDTPALVRMVHYSLEMLQKPDHTDGFLLFVEDGNIRRAHGQNKPRKAFDQVRHYANAFNMAKMMANEQNTLFISMNDVGSTLALPGYPARSSDPMGTAAGTSNDDALPYLGLSYATGPAHSHYYRAGVGRLDPMEVLQGVPNALERTCPALVPMAEGADGGEDASVYASGPWAFMLSGGYEQHFVAHTIAFASCMDGACDGAATLVLSWVAILGAVGARLFA